MKAINWNNFNTQFGESFIRTLERERTLRQQQEEFNRKMQFENRQLTLYTDIAKERSAIEKEQSLGSMYREGFIPDTETPDIKMFGQGLDYPKMLPEVPKPYNETKLEPYSQGGDIEVKYEVDPNDPTKRRVIDYGTWFKPPKPNKGGNGNGNGNGDKNYKEPKLEQFRDEALRELETPALTGDDGKILNSSDLSLTLDDNITTLGTGVIDSDISAWLKDIKTAYKRYPDPNTLKEEFLQENKWTDEQIAAFETFLNYYYKAYGGIKKVQQRIINPKSFGIE